MPLLNNSGDILPQGPEEILLATGSAEPYVYVYGLVIIDEVFNLLSC